MKYSEVSGLSEKEMRKKAVVLEKELFDAKMKNSLGQLQNVSSIKSIRRDVARLKMAISSKNKRG